MFPSCYTITCCREKLSPRKGIEHLFEIPLNTQRQCNVAQRGYMLEGGDFSKYLYNILPAVLYGFVLARESSTFHRVRLLALEWREKRGASYCRLQSSRQIFFKNGEHCWEPHSLPLTFWFHFSSKTFLISTLAIKIEVLYHPPVEDQRHFVS